MAIEPPKNLVRTPLPESAHEDKKREEARLDFRVRWIRHCVWNEGHRLDRVVDVLAGEFEVDPQWVRDVATYRVEAARCEMWDPIQPMERQL